MRRARYFSSLLWLFFRSVISLCLTLCLVASFVLAWQIPRIERALSDFLANDAAGRGAILAHRLEQNALVRQASVASLLIEDITIDDSSAELPAVKLGVSKVIVLSDISLDFFANIDVSCKSLKINWLARPLSVSTLFLPSSIVVEGLRMSVPLASNTFRAEPEPASEETFSDADTGSFATKWRPIGRALGWLAFAIKDRKITLQDSEFVLRTFGSADASTADSLRLRFAEISLEGRNGLTWQGEGRGVVERGADLRVTLQGNYAPLSSRFYQSLSVEDFSPRQVLRQLSRPLAMSLGERDMALGNNFGNNFDNNFDNNIASNLANNITKAARASEQTRAWLARAGDLRVNYSHDFDDTKGWLKVGFGLPSRAVSLAFDHSYDRLSGGWSTSNFTFNDLPLDFVWSALSMLPERFASGGLAPESLPFALSGQAFGYLSLRYNNRVSGLRTSLLPNLDGEIRLEKPSLRWVNFAQAGTSPSSTSPSSTSPSSTSLSDAVDLHQLTLAFASTGGGSLKIDASIDVREGFDAGMDASVELTPPQEAGAASTSSALLSALEPTIELKLTGKSRGSIDAETVLGLWPPGFKSNVRSLVRDVLRAGQMRELDITVASRFALADKKARIKARPKARPKVTLAQLDGSFQLDEGVLRIFADPLTIRRVSSTASFDKDKITFNISSGRYRENFLLRASEVSFERRKNLVGNSLVGSSLTGRNFTFMDASLTGSGAAEDLRFLLSRAPFLQNLTFLQRSLRLLPNAPSARGEGSFNLRAFTKQLKFTQPKPTQLKPAIDAATLELSLLHPLYYDTTWDFERVRFLAPVLRFYEGEGRIASSSSHPLDLALSLSSERGNKLTLSWDHDILADISASDATQLRQSGLSKEHLELSGTLDASAMASDFGYLPSAWLADELPLRFSYDNHSLSPARARLSFGKQNSRQNSRQDSRIEVASEYLGGSLGLRIFGGSPDVSAASGSDAFWTIEGNYNHAGNSSLLLRKLRREDSHELLSLLLQNDAASDASDASDDGDDGDDGYASNTSSATTPSPSSSPFWRVLAAGESLDLSSWVAEKPWQALRADDADSGGDSQTDFTSSQILPYLNLDLAIRLDALRLQANDGSSSDSDFATTEVTSPSNLLENVQSDFSWRGGVLQAATFSSTSLSSPSSGRRAKSKKKKNKKQENKKKTGSAGEQVSTNILYDLRNDEELLLLESNDLGDFISRSHGSIFAEGGKARVLFSRAYKPNERPRPHFIGYGKIDDLSLYDMPLLFKLWNSIGLVGAFSKGVKRLRVSSDLSLWDGVLSLDNFKLANNLTALTARGSIDIEAKQIDLRGEIASLPIVSNFLRNIPILGYVLVGRKRNNLFAFSYDAKGDWAKPKVEASPISFLLPGIVKVANPLQFLENDEIRKAQQLKRDEIARIEQEKKNNKNEQKREQIEQGE